MTRAVVFIRDERDRQRCAKWAAGVPVGTRVEWRAPCRSLDQNALLWARLGEISRKVEWYGQFLSAEDWKNIFTASLRKARVIPGIEAGTFVTLGLSTSDMDKEEFGMLLDLIDAFAAQQGVVFDYEDKQFASAER